MKKEAMRSFLERHGKEFFTATELARKLDWMRTKKWKDSDGEEHSKSYLNTKAVIRVAKKVANISRSKGTPGMKDEVYYVISAR